MGVEARRVGSEPTCRKCACFSGFNRRKVGRKRGGQVQSGNWIDEAAYFQQLKMAERVGFEPTCRLRDKTLSRRPRYDHFGTSPFFTSLGGAPLTVPTSLRARGRASRGFPPALACSLLHSAASTSLRLPRRSLGRSRNQVEAFATRSVGRPPVVGWKPAASSYRSRLPSKKL